MQKDFYINDQFLVKPGANLVIDGLISKISRVEPEAMQLLCVLAGKAGALFSREELKKKIWAENDRADEQLDRAVIHLRKLLQDEKTNLIRSSAGKGYGLYAAVSNADIDDLRNEAKKQETMPVQKTAGQKWIMILSLLIVLLLISFVLFNYTYSDEPSQEPLFPEKADSGQPSVPVENENNTVISLGPDSVIYKLVLTGDSAHRFFVNEKELSGNEWSPYQPVINSLKRQLKDKQAGN